jgi:hypothetical protein
METQFSAKWDGVQGLKELTMKFVFREKGLLLDHVKVGM